MKKLSVMIVTMVVMCAMHVFASSYDTVLSFCTKGPDQYKDGTPVLDGEFYAIVASTDAVFAGFKMDGTFVNASDNLLYRAPLAKDGKCTYTTVQIPYRSVEGKKLFVVMMDTRIPGEVLVAGGNIVRGYGVIGQAAGGIATVAAAVPAVSDKGASVSDIPQPVITGVVIEGGVATLTVSNTVPGAYYTVTSGDTVTNFSAPLFDTFAKTGVADGTITLTIPVTDAMKFFKVAVPQQ